VAPPALQVNGPILGVGVGLAVGVGVGVDDDAPARSLIRLLPFGVPQPVQRSYPVTAENLPPLLLVILLPVVIS
jgi:hypothetical protein